MFKIALTAPHKTTLLLHPGLLTSLFTFFMYCVSPDNNRLLPGSLNCMPSPIQNLCMTCGPHVYFCKVLSESTEFTGEMKGISRHMYSNNYLIIFFFSSKASFQLWYSWDFCFRLHCPPDYRLPEPALPPIPGSAYSSLCYTEQFGSLQLHERAHKNKVFFYF